MEKKIELNDLLPVYELGNNIFLMILEEDLGKVNSLCVQVNLYTNSFGDIMEIGKYMTFNPFSPIDFKNPDIRKVYQLLIRSKFIEAEISNMLTEFTLKRKVYNQIKNKNKADYF